MVNHIDQIKILPIHKAMMKGIIKQKLLDKYPVLSERELSFYRIQELMIKELLGLDYQMEYSKLNNEREYNKLHTN